MRGQRHAPAAFYPPWNTRYPLYRRLSGSHGRSGHVRKISLPPEFDPQTVQPVASRYTDYATRPFLPTVTRTNSGAKDWMNLKQVDVWIKKRSFLPSPSVEWGDKKMGSADHSFASDMACSTRLPGRKSSGAWLWLLRAYLHEGMPFVLFSSVSVWVCVCVCVCVSCEERDMEPFVTNLTFPPYMATQQARVFCN